VAVRGIRGATTVATNDAAEVLAATRELLREMIACNEIDPTEVASAIFSTTPDVTAEFPAVAARQLGWISVPLMCTHEMAVPGSLPGCIRVLIHLNTDKPQSDIRHIYLREAVVLRRDLQEKYGSSSMRGPE
jgi:chorismate mutase